MWQIEQLKSGLSELQSFSDKDMGVVLVGTWGSQRPAFQILVLVARHEVSLTQRHEWLTQVLELTRNIGLGLSWQDIRFILPSDLAPPSLSGGPITLGLDRPIPDDLLMLVDGMALSTPKLLESSRLLVIQNLATQRSESNPDMPFLRLAHALQECWHRLCLHAAVHPEMERHQFGWRLVLQSLIAGLLHFKPADAREVLRICQMTPLDRIAGLLKMPGFDGTWMEDHQFFLEDFQSLMELRSIKPGSAPVAMSHLTQRRYNRFFYRLLTHPNVDESLRYTLLS